MNKNREQTQNLGRDHHHITNVRRCSDSFFVIFFMFHVLVVCLLPSPAMKTQFLFSSCFFVFLIAKTINNTAIQLMGSIKHNNTHTGGSDTLAIELSSMTTLKLALSKVHKPKYETKNVYLFTITNFATIIIIIAITLSVVFGRLRYSH